jgi:uncharacterized repeat protein (TIGR01451 family)
MAQKGRTKRRNILLLSATLSGLVATTAAFLALRQAGPSERQNPRITESRSCGYGLCFSLQQDRRAVESRNSSQSPCSRESVHYVAPRCAAVPTPCYTTVQEAVDTACDGDVIKVAAGTYTGVNVRPRGDSSATGVVTQVVYISKTVTYTLFVHSGGVHPATHVWLTDTLPALQQALAVTSTRGQCTSQCRLGRPGGLRPGHDGAERQCPHHARRLGDADAARPGTPVDPKQRPSRGWRD